MSLPWFRMYAEFAGDPVVQSLAFEDQRHYVVVLCLKCNGTLDRPMASQVRDRVIVTALHVTEAEAEDIKERLMEVGLIDRAWQPVEWGAREPERPPAHEWRRLREAVFARDDYTCAYCGQRGGRLECDHVVPVSRGGSHDEDNLTTACFTCNRSKRDKLPEEWVH